MGNLDINVYELEEYLPTIAIGEDSGNKRIVDDNDDLEELKKQFVEDMDQEQLKNVSEEKLIQLVKRYRSVVKKVKQRSGYKCQICGQNFLMDNGRYYCEAHHIIPISEDGSQSAENVIVLCANHHRMFHYAKGHIAIKVVSGKRIVSINGIEYCIDS